MDPREADLRTKLRDLESLKAAGDPTELVTWADNAKLALEFRETDAMIGLDPIAGDLVAALETARLEALALASARGSMAACIEYAQSVWETKRTDAAGKAVELATKAAVTPEGAYLLGLFAFNGFGLPKDLASSLAYHRKAADLGHSGAMFELYAMLSQGLGAPANDDEAMRWCHRSAEAGNTRAMANLGGYYATGRGVPKDEALSLKWYDKAARQGHGRAAATLGVMYALGSGAPASTDKAKEYFALADEWGYDWRDLADAQGIDPEEFEA